MKKMSFIVLIFALVVCLSLMGCSGPQISIIPTSPLTAPSLVSTPSLAQSSAIPVAQVIKPFLTLPFSAELKGKLEISQGWIYSEDEKAIHPDTPTHYAVDFPLPWGTPVYAPADGFGLSTYHTYLMDGVDGVKKIKIGFGLGLFVQIYHPDKGLYSSYSHLSKVPDNVAYIAPQIKDGEANPQIIYNPVEVFLKSAKAIKKGDLIGYVGYSGLLPDMSESPSNPVSFDSSIQKTWDPHGAHLHWEIFDRLADGSKKNHRFDPFDIYLTREKYSDIFTKTTGLVLADTDGSPQFAK